MKRQIKVKILKAFLSVSITSMVIAGIAAGLTMINLFNVAVDTNNTIGQNAVINSEEALTEQAVANMRELAGANAGLINADLSETANALQKMRDTINFLYENSDDINALPFPYVRDAAEGEFALHWVTAPDVSAGELENEIFLHGNMSGLYSAVVDINPNISTIYFMSESGFATAYDDTASYKPDYWDGRSFRWYIEAKESGGLFISDSYQDVFGRGLNISMALPGYFNEHFIGVIGLDVLIENLNESVQKTKILESGYAMLIDNGQRIISAPGLTDENQENMAYFLGENYVDILRNMQTHKSGAEKTVINSEVLYIIWDSVELTGWNYVLLMPYDEIIEAAIQNSAVIEALSNQKAQEMSRQILVGSLIFIALF
ncbi:MAG: cache domain-containing protein, partial [Oscillospiraceae bacterium]|nr:cache domain-containing protein [Oscillospiraceae bacterium]